MLNKNTFIELFDKNHHEEYLRFEEIDNPPFESKDLCGFHKLYQFLKQDEKHKDIVRDSRHDEIYLCGLDDLDLNNMTENDIIYLIRCGVRYDEEYDCFCMFV